MPTPDNLVYAILDDNFQRNPQAVSVEGVSVLTRLDVTDVLRSLYRLERKRRIEAVRVEEVGIVGVSRTFSRL